MFCVHLLVIYDVLRGILIVYFSKTVIISYCKASSGRADIGNNWRGMWKEAIVSWVQIHPEYLAGEAEGNN